MRFVAYADVLGYRAIVEQNDPVALSKKYDMFLATTEIGASQGRWGIADDGLAYADVTTATINMLVVSDSVFLWTDDATAASFTHLVLSVGKMLVTGLATGFPMRAGIAYGDVQVTDVRYTTARLAARPIFGAGLVDAVACEEQQQWSGAMVTEAALDAYTTDLLLTPEQPSMLHPHGTGHLVRHDVPVKEGTLTQAVAVNWPKFNPSPVTESMIASAFGMHGRSVDDRAARKLDNTLAFLRSVS